MIFREKKKKKINREMTSFKSILKTDKFEYSEDAFELRFTADSKTMDALVERKKPLKKGDYDVHVDFSGETEEGEPELVVSFTESGRMNCNKISVPVADIKDAFWKSIAKAGLGGCGYDWDKMYSDPKEWPIESAIQAEAFTKEELAKIKKILFAALGRMSPEQQKSSLVRSATEACRGQETGVK